MNETTKDLRQLVSLGECPCESAAWSHWDQAIQAAADRLEELEAIVARVPKTADGVPVVPGDTVYAKRNPSDDTVVEFEVADYEKWAMDAWGSRNQARAYTEGGGGWIVSRHCYSTREAAEAAVKGGE